MADLTVLKLDAGEILDIPVTPEPGSVVLWCSEDDVVWSLEYLVPPYGVIMDHASASWSAGTLTITTTATFWVGMVACFERTLETDELNRIMYYTDINGFSVNSFDKWREMEMALARRVVGTVGVAGLPGTGITEPQLTAITDALAALQGAALGDHTDTLFAGLTTGDVVTWDGSQFVNQQVVQGLSEVQEFDITVNTAPVAIIDFDGAQWDIQEPTPGKISVLPVMGTGADQFAEGNHVHNASLIDVGISTSIANVSSGVVQMATVTVGPLESGVTYDVAAIASVECYSTTGGASTFIPQLVLNGNTQAYPTTTAEGGVDGPKVYAHNQTVVGAGGNVTATLNMDWSSGSIDPVYAWVLIMAFPRR
jgi:hypothetical protein